jgi:hypothetical protein
MQKLSARPQDFGRWAGLQRSLYVDDRQSLERDPGGAQQGPGVRELFDVTLAKALIDRGMPGRAQEILTAIPQGQVTPRVQYYLAETFMAQGQAAKGRSLLEKLVVESPQDVFSSKARIYLLEIDAKTRM